MNTKKVPVIHQTDLFHCPADPDDHWDLACQYALSYSGDIDLKGILIDYCYDEAHTRPDIGDPAVIAVNQLNYLTGQFVPTAIGHKTQLYSDADVQKVSAAKPLNSGVAMVLHLLETAEEPVVLHIVGSCRDIAIASMMRPDLFREKCKALYLNAGSGLENQLEWNVHLDPYSYSKMFQLPCPLYWMPCFHEWFTSGEMFIGTYGTFYKFQQKEILPHISETMQKFFNYALGGVIDDRWLRYLDKPVDEKISADLGEKYRNMWCTAGFLHTAGKTVTVDGEIVDLGTEGISPVFDFIPIDATCNADGRVNWQEVSSSNQHIFKVLDVEKYQAAMTKALKTLVAQLP